MNIPLAVLIAVLVLIAVRRIGSVPLRIWQIMTAGAVAVLLTGQITPHDAIAAINPDVMVFLFCTFVIGQALEESGFLAHQSYNVFKRARTMRSLLILWIAGTAVTSAILMNDTLAIVGTPVALLLARRHDVSPKPLLLALMFSVTIGSVPSPIGNPQNLLLALHASVRNPFMTFLAWLAVPTVVNLAVVYILVRVFHREEFHQEMLSHSQEPIRNRRLAFLANLSLRLLLLLVAFKLVAGIAGLPLQLRLTHIAVAAALPILVAAPGRFALLKGIDWPTLAFFASMFVLMQSVWNTGFLQNLVTLTNVPITSYEAIIGISIVVSQFISNVPLVALYQPLMESAGARIPELMALAAGSTIAGNMTIIGAASNVIVLQAAERRGWTGITWLDFVRIGAPLTILNAAIHLAWFHLVGLVG